MPIFNHSEIGRVLFIHIPKAAGSSVEKWLKDHGYKLDKINYYQGDKAQHAPRAVYEQWGEFDYKFTIVREPLDRFVSSLGYRGVHAGDANRTAKDALKRHEKGILQPGWGNHLQPQVDFLSEGVEIFRFEEPFFQRISARLGIPGPFPHENKSRTPVAADHLSDEVKQAIYRLYAEDYKVLGYDSPFEYLER